MAAIRSGDIDLGAQVEDMHYNQCTLANGFVFRMMTFSVSSECWAGYAAFKPKSKHVTLRNKAAELYVAKHGQRPPGLSSRCQDALLTRTLDALDDAKSRGATELSIANGCCDRPGCPKELYHAALLQALASPVTQ